MEASLAQERALEQYVHQLLKDKDQPIGNVLQAFDSYRKICQANLLADLESTADNELRLWQAHTAGRQYFRRELNSLRKRGNQFAVQMRGFIKLYLQFLKESERFYRGYIHQLHRCFGGISELEAVAQQVPTHSGDANESESSQLYVSPERRARVVASCHQTLIYLGDLSRYRASDKLDKNPDFGRALGYYGLACTLSPTSGLGHHQQAVTLAQSQRNDLRAIYHFYRAIVVDEPHPNAAKNLELEFDKTAKAWSRGEPLQHGPANDAEGPKRLLIGWFVRLHSRCFKGEQFPGFQELEQTLLGQLSTVVKNTSLEVENTLMRMVMVNIAAQHYAGEMVQREANIQHQQAYFYFLRLNIRFYTAFLEIFFSNVGPTNDPEADGEDLMTKLAPPAFRVLPGLRLYSAWLLANIHMITGLASDDFLKGAVDGFWHSYARVINVIADEDVFGVWAFDDFGASYMLKEDCETLGFRPVQNRHQKVWRNWLLKETGALKPRFSDAHAEVMSPDHEMLARVKDILEDGMFLCHEEKEAPITLVGTTAYYGVPPEEAVKAAEKAKMQPPKPFPKPKPLSYAKAAATGHGKRTAQFSKHDDASSTASSHTRRAQLTRMVDELVEDEDSNNPVTPPQQHAVNPTVVTNGEVSINAMNGIQYGVQQDFATVPSYQPKLPSSAVPYSSRALKAVTPPSSRTQKDAMAGNSLERLRSESVSGLWHGSPTISASPSFPPGLPTGTLSSPANVMHHKHSRGNSASSNHSKISAQDGAIGDSWSNLESGSRRAQAPHPQALAHDNTMDGYANFSTSGIASPLLFGAGSSMWSANSSGYLNNNALNGQTGQHGSGNSDLNIMMSPHGQGVGQGG